MATHATCPSKHQSGGGTSNRDWWPNALRLERPAGGVRLELGGPRGLCEVYGSSDAQEKLVRDFVKGMDPHERHRVDDRGMSLAMGRPC